MASRSLQTVLACVAFVASELRCAADDRPVAACNAALPNVSGPAAPGQVRVAAVQAKRRSINYRLNAADVMSAVDRNLDELEAIVQQAAERNCVAVAFPEDTLGLLDWIGMNESASREVLPKAVGRMLERMGRMAAAHQMFIVVSSDIVEENGGMYNTAFLIGRDGKEIGRYHKTCPTWFECGARQRG